MSNHALPVLLLALLSGLACSTKGGGALSKAEAGAPAAGADNEGGSSGVGGTAGGSGGSGARGGGEGGDAGDDGPGMGGTAGGSGRGGGEPGGAAGESGAGGAGGNGDDGDDRDCLPGEYVLDDRGVRRCVPCPTGFVSTETNAASCSFMEVAAGTTHSCALLEHGEVRCWGSAFRGGLGYGDTINDRETPGGDLDTSGPVSQIVASYHSACALLADGRLRCWGSNGNGELGYGDTEDRAAPSSDVDVGGEVVQVAHGGARTCAVLVDGNVRCWGSDQGSLGYGDTGTAIRSSPGGNIAVGGHVVQVALGLGVCALLDDGNVRCWGDNGLGELGYGDTLDRRVPSENIALGGRVTQITSGIGHTCALLENGNVRCWGGNWMGQLGYGHLEPGTSPGGNVDLGGPAAQIAAGDMHTCALLRNGNVRCWGYNARAQLGYGDQVDRLVPGPDVNVGGPVTQLSGGALHTCAVLRNGKVRCWGDNFSRQLSYVQPRRPSPGPALRIDGPVAGLTAGAGHTCALLTGGSVHCWGSDANGRLGIDTSHPAVPGSGIDFGSAATALTAGRAHSCAVLSGGSLRCWGYNGNGLLGVGGTQDGLPQSNVAVGGAVVRAAAGSSHTCAVLDDGNVRCWGDNTNGQLGYGDDVRRPLPGGDVAVGGRVVEIAANDDFTCAVLDDGNVRCWGYNGNGQLGYGDGTTRRSPGGDVNVGGEVRAISLGETFGCALLRDGNVRCWGGSGSGALGYGDTLSMPEPGGNVALGSTANQIAAGYTHTCALLAQGRVRCWGDNQYGQLGYGDFAERRTPNGDVDLGGPAIGIAAGHSFTCALMADGRVRCWGDDSVGQLGYGSDRTIVGNDPEDMPPGDVPGL